MDSFNKTSPGSEELMFKILDELGVEILVMDAESRIVFANKIFLKNHGLHLFSIKNLF